MKLLDLQVVKKLENFPHIRRFLGGVVHTCVLMEGFLDTVHMVFVAYISVADVSSFKAYFFLKKKLIFIFFSMSI